MQPQPYLANIVLVAGFELFGEEKVSCEEGEWEEEIPHCATNVAK